jgi:hypothetical protein
MDNKVRKRIANNIGTALIDNHAKEIDLEREFSYGHDKQKNMLGASKTGQQMAIRFRNASGADKFIFIQPSLTMGVVSNAERLKQSFGVPYTDVNFTESDPGEGRVGITALDPEKTIENFRGYTATVPTQLTKLHFKSKTLDGKPDDSNFDEVVTTFYLSPFQAAKKSTFNLRTLQNSSMQQVQFLELDLLKENFPVIISQEHLLMIKVKANTELTLTMSIGAQDSRPQRLHRKLKAVQNIVSSLM